MANKTKLKTSTSRGPKEREGAGKADQASASSASSKALDASELAGAASIPPEPRFPVVGVGASAGGLEAFTALLTALPGNTGMAFVLVQHMDPHHQSVLTSLLQKATLMPVREVIDGMAVQPNHVYVIPPNALMTISDGFLALTPRAQHPTRNLPIDHFFHTLGDDLKSGAIGVILSGTASDGTQGLKAIKAQGGITFAQDQDSVRLLQPYLPACSLSTLYAPLTS